jgi:hypothetical protein
MLKTPQYPEAARYTAKLQEIEIEAGSLVSMLDRTCYPGMHTCTTTQYLAPAFSVTISQALYEALLVLNNGLHPITPQWREVLRSWQKHKKRIVVGQTYYFSAPIGKKGAHVVLRFLHRRDASNRRYLTFALANGDIYATNYQ